MRTRQDILMSAFVAAASVHGYSAFLPPVFTIRSFGGQPGAQETVRHGELAGTLFALGLGGIVAVLTEDWLPLTFAAGTSVVMVAVYEWALASVGPPQVTAARTIDLVRAA